MYFAFDTAPLFFIRLSTNVTAPSFLLQIGGASISVGVFDMLTRYTYS